MKFKSLAAASVAALLVLSACGTDADDEMATDPTTVAATTEAPMEETEAPMEETETPMEETEAPAEGAGTIVDVAAGNEDFETLVAAVTAADLVETLSSEGPFTVFAPTDAAFEALPEGLLDALLLPENKDALTSILTYHVLAGEVMSADVTAGDVETVEGSTLALMTEGGVMVNDATVVTADVDASNGVIHAIDGVLVPPSVDVDALLG
ncbi:MAG: fasciclin domain-containing protein [Arachnia sp.]